MRETKTEYFFSKTAIIFASLLLLVVLFLFAFLIYILYSADLNIAMFICLFFFLLILTTVPGIYRRIHFFLAGKPALILTKDELIDNINLQKFKWTDIKSISAESIKVKARIKYIAILLNNPGEYIDVIKNPYKRLIARLNHKYFGGAFSIQPNIIKCKNTELLERLAYYLTNTNGQNSR